MFFELSWACEVEGGMAPDGIVEPIDVAANSLVGFVAGVEDSPPDELGFQGLEERLHHGVIVAIPLAGHRDQDAVLVELGLIIDRAILAVRVHRAPHCSNLLNCAVSSHYQFFGLNYQADRSTAPQLKLNTSASSTERKRRCII